MNATVSGASPFVGAAPKAATGAGSVTMIRLACVSTSEPPGPVTVKLTVYVPAAVYSCVGFDSVELPLSPKSQE